MTQRNALAAGLLNMASPGLGFLYLGRPRWAFAVPLGLLLFWAGAWLRREHSPLVWTATAAVFAFSMIVSLVGMTEPYPRDGYDRYTAAQALQRLVHPVPKDVLAGR